MPELPDLTVYQHCLQQRAVGQPLQALKLLHPFLLRSVAPPPAAFEGRRLEAVRRIGKRLVFVFAGEHYALLHLMRLGRLHWKPLTAKPGRALLSMQFEAGQLLLTESGSRRAAALHLLDCADALAEFDRGGVEPLHCSAAEFEQALKRENHTLKRALSDARIVAGIGNAYSDEILHAARLSPFLQTHRLSAEQLQALYAATRDCLQTWSARLLAETGDGWPAKVTAFRPEMAVHGRYRQPCPVCQAPVQRIAYVDSEANYCARCQTDGRVLADRALSRLLKSNWPRRIEDLEGS